MTNETPGPRPVEKKIVGGSEVLKSPDDSSVTIRGIRDEMGSSVVMDLLKAHDRDIWITLKDKARPNKPDLVVRFRSNGSTYPDAQPILSDLVFHIAQCEGRLSEGYVRDHQLVIPDEGQWVARKGAKVVMDNGKIMIRNVECDEGGEVLMDLVETASNDMIIALKRNPKAEGSDLPQYLQCQMQFNTLIGGTRIPVMSYFLRRLAFVLATEKDY